MNDSFPFSDRSERHHSTALGSSKLRFEFTGTGGHYFKIWIVDLMLTLATLGLYYPWAKVRRLQYFFKNTQLDGDPLEYDGAPPIIARGHALILTLVGLFWVVGVYSAGAASAVLLGIVALSPALLRASLRYHLSHTTWRGLRFGFNGTQKQAYWSTMPLLGVAGALLAEVLLILTSKAQSAWQGYSALALLIICLAVAPWLAWSYKQYQHKHFTLGKLASRFKATASDYYRLFLQIYLFSAALISIATAITLDWLDATVPSALGRTTLPHNALSTTALVCLGAVALVLWLTVKPFATSRLQNMVWTQTGNSSMRCVSKLHYRALMWLGLKNSLLMVATLGLYWPYAAVATARLRVESVSIKIRVDPNVLISTARPASGKTAASHGIEIAL